MSNALKFPLQKQTCKNKKIKVGLQLEQKINQSAIFRKITHSFTCSISTEFILQKIGGSLTCGWLTTRFDSERLTNGVIELQVHESMNVSITFCLKIILWLFMKCFNCVINLLITFTTYICIHMIKKKCWYLSTMWTISSQGILHLLLKHT